MNSILQPRWFIEGAKSCFVDICHLFFVTWLKIVLYPYKLFMDTVIYDIILPITVKIVDIWTRLVDILPQRMARYLRWCPTSDAHLKETEEKILSHVKTPYSSQFIHIQQSWSSQDIKIWTIVLNPLGKNTPLVMVHGFGLGIVQWVLNYDYLAADRPVYAFDIPGFGRSARIQFGSDPQEVELRFVECIEAWRQELGLEHFILLGHDFGGFITTTYALQHPQIIDHLILVDPWGFPEQALGSLNTFELPEWVHQVAKFASYFNPLAILRFCGPLGPNIVNSFRKDMGLKFSSVVSHPSVILDYIYHTNVQNPTGEEAKTVMTDEGGWAKFPMINRMADLDERMPITFIHGSRSMVDKQPGRQIQYTRLRSEVNVETIQGGGIHVYADKSSQFNTLVLSTCQRVDASRFSQDRASSSSIIKSLSS